MSPPVYPGGKVCRFRRRHTEVSQGVTGSNSLLARRVSITGFAKPAFGAQSEHLAPSVENVTSREAFAPKMEIARIVFDRRWLAALWWESLSRTEFDTFRQNPYFTLDHSRLC